MKIRILTFHMAHNYGAVLQAYALQSYLKDNTNGDVAFQNYIPKELELNKPVIFKKIKNVKEIGKNIYTYNGKIKRYNKFEQFKKTFLSIDEESYNTEVNNTDCYIVGSDQVWNKDILKKIDRNYYLDFVSKAKKISYAASFGRESIEENEKRIVKSHISKFDAVAVREKSGCNIINDILPNTAIKVVDPVFLLDIKKYVEIMINPKEKDYLLIYTLEDNLELIKEAQNIAKKKNLKIISIGGGKNKYNADKHYSGLGPQEFLGMIKNAKFVISNSFHTIAFSIIFERQFVYVKLKNNRGTRIISLLESLNLEDRVLNDKNNGEYRDIYYNHVRNKLRDEISHSKKFLLDNLT